MGCRGASECGCLGFSASALTADFEASELAIAEMQMLDDEHRNLQAEIYHWPNVDPPIRRLAALERFKA